MDEIIDAEPDTEFFNEEEADLEFKSKVENREPIRIFINDHIAGKRGRFIIEQLRYLKEMEWIGVKSYKTKAKGVYMVFNAPKRIITEV